MAHRKELRNNRGCHFWQSIVGGAALDWPDSVWGVRWEADRWEEGWGWALAWEGRLRVAHLEECLASLLIKKYHNRVPNS